jgi:diguanylate cyclase (GGDEF)-like protein/PAS domain S-box-containing protein
MNLSYALSLFISSLATMIITVIGLRRRSVPGGGSVASLGIAMTVWVMGAGCYWLVDDPALKLFWFNVSYTGVVVVPLTFLLFSVRYTNRTRVINKRTIALLSVIPFATLIIIWTDPWHGFFYNGHAPAELASSGGAWFWIQVTYSYGLAVFAFIRLLRSYVSTIRPFRAQLRMILLGALLPVAVNVSMILGYQPFPGLDLTPHAFVFSSICLTVAFSQYHLFDIVPVARSVAIEQMTDGFIVLDAVDRVVDVNQAALKILGKPSESILGLPATKALQKFSAFFDQISESGSFKQEIEVEPTPNVHYDVSVSPIYDQKNRYSGRLIVARDITDRKLAEQSEHEQRVLAEALRDSAAALNSSGSFEEVLDKILDNVGRVVPFDLATFLLADGAGRAHLVRERGYREHGLDESLHKVHFTVDTIPNFQRMIDTGSSVVIPDTAADKDWIKYENLERLRSYVGAPIRARDQIVGLLDLASFTPGFYSQVHADRLQAFADQAAIAMENARLLEDTRLRADELSTLLDIGQTATSGLEMGKVIGVLLEKCLRVLPIEAFYIATYDNVTQMIAYPVFYDQGEVSVLPAHSLDDSSGLTGQIIRTRKMIYIPDVLDEDSAKEYNIVHFGGKPSRSYVGVPLMVGDLVVGVISMQSSDANAYLPGHIRLLETIGTQVAGAIENARLFEEVRLRAEEMTALFDIGITVTSGLEMAQVLKTLLDKCRQVLPVEAFYIAILDSEKGLIHHPLAYDMGEYPHIPTRDIRENPGLSGHIINTRKTLYIPDMSSPDAIKTFRIFRTSGTPTQAYVGVPMIVGDDVVGVVSMQSYHANAYDANQIRLLETIATQAAVAIENSQLYAKAQQEILERQKAEGRYRALFEQSHDAVFIVSFTGAQIDVNQRACEMLGYSESELLAMKFKDLTIEPEASDEVIERLLKGEHIPLYELMFCRKDGELITAEVNAELVRDADGEPLHIQSVVRDITERKQSELKLHDANEHLRLEIAEKEQLQAQLREQVIRDPLTGLFNRRFLEETLQREFSLAKRQSTTVCLVMIDIDQFKAYNDTYGHEAGDTLLKELGELLRKEVRQSDISCRYGGEEFLVVMPGAALEQGVERAELLRVAFSTGKYSHTGAKLNATISLGVATYPTHGGTWEEVLRVADRAMYVAKAAGKNRVASAGN